MATQSSILAWRIPWPEEPGGRQSMGLQRVGHEWRDGACTQRYSVKKLRYIYAMEYYSAIKRNEFEPILVGWMNLGPIIQSEVSQKEKNRYHILMHIYVIYDLLGGGSGKEPTCQCRRHKRHGFNPWVRKIPWRRAWQPILVFLPGESHGQRTLVGYSP